MIVVLVVIVLLSAAPIISAMIASPFAGAKGCVLHEGFVNPCLVDGEDMGETLYQMFVMGWFMLLTLPIGLVALAIWFAVAFAMGFGGRGGAAS